MPAQGELWRFPIRHTVPRMRQLPVQNVLDGARFYLQVLGEHCAADDYIHLTKRVDQIDNLLADTPMHAREQYRQAIEVHRQIIAAVQRHSGDCR